ncbi:MAG: type II toxin-antitoxin system VapC family toxin [Actinomycetota bacterium]
MAISLLLDTHALVWAVANPDRLSDAARVQISDPSTNLVVSAVSALELSTKVRLGKLPEAEPLVHQYHETIRHLGARHLPIEANHALRAGLLRWDHRDPFDRLLAAQSILENHTLISRDAAFAELGGLQVLW